MKKTLMAAVAALALSAAPVMAAETFHFDPTHTSVTWHAGHFGFSTPSGKFASVNGTVTLDEKAPEKSTVEIKIDTAVLVTGIEKFDAHLKSADFFNVEKYPAAHFKSTKVTVTGQDTAKVEGILTLLDVAKPVTLDVKLNKIGENPFNQKKQVGFTASTVIKRSEFGINYALPNVPDDVKIDIEAEAALP